MNPAQLLLNQMMNSQQVQNNPMAKMPCKCIKAEIQVDLRQWQRISVKKEELR